MHKRFLLSLPFALAFQACQSTSNQVPEDINQFFDQAFEERLLRSPQRMTYLGMKHDYDKLDDLSEERQNEDFAIVKRQLQELKQYDPESLGPQEQLSYLLFEEQLKRKIADFDFRYHNYPVNQMFGLQSSLPNFMMTMHRVDQKSDAEAYISRLNQVDQQFQQLINGLKKRENLGIIPPRFVFDAVIRDSQNIISGFPFDKTQAPSTIYDDFQKKVVALKLSEEETEQLLQQGQEALLNSLGPAYRSLIAYMQDLEKKAPLQGSASALPNGETFYQHELQQYTTTNYSPEQIHQLGLAEVARIQKEMEAIKNKVGFQGSLKDFFQFLSKNQRFYYPQTAAGREAYLKDARAYIEAFKKRMPEAFGILPKADIEVRAVEAYREQSAGKAFYNSPALDGSRPGIYYVNLYDLKGVPKYEMEALAYHEGIPGHHLQLAISQELENLPKFRRFAGYTAYSEGWGLYSEYLPKEMDFYQDPYSDFGRLSMELWRACRLVVDTGLHAKGWTREKAIQYLQEVTPASDGEIVKAVERYIVMPGQATAYKIGSLKILELRQMVKEALGESFSLAGFHDVILRDGPLPLNVLEQKVRAWVSSEQK
ncbi:MAG: DUF885 domain-containing protein [Oligoflexus sp.]